MADFLQKLGLERLLRGDDSSRSHIFVSYRREDARGDAGRLTDDLKEAFGARRIFRDIEAIEPGVDFVEALKRAVSLCPVMLAIIGPNWSSVKGADGRRRLDDPNDFIRLEIGTALARNIRIIPVLVGGATIPRAEDLPEDLQGLARRQAYELSDRRWEFDVNQLIEPLEKIVGPRQSKHQDNKAGEWWRNKRLGWALAAAVIVLIGAIVAEFDNNRQFVPPQPLPLPQPYGASQPFAQPPIVPTLSSYGLSAVGRFPSIVQVLKPG